MGDHQWSVRGKWMGGGLQNVPLKFLYVLAHHMERSWNGRRSLISARIVTNSSPNMAQNVSPSVSFHLHYFLCPSEHFLPKELSQFVAPIPGGHMELLEGWSNLCRKCRHQDLHQHFREQRR
jgi:hypothetical protein